MPRLDGFEFLERFRMTEAGRSTPVIVWTVKDLTTHDQARLRQTAQAVVTKGNNGAAALLRELDAFLPRRQVSEYTEVATVAGEWSLIVDDNELNVKQLRWVLEKQGHTGHTSSD